MKCASEMFIKSVIIWCLLFSESVYVDMSLATDQLYMGEFRALSRQCRRQDLVWGGARN